MTYNLQNIPSANPEKQRLLREALMDLLDPSWRERERAFREAQREFDYAGIELRILASFEANKGS